MLSSRKKIKERDWMLVELVRDFLKVFDDSKKKKMWCILSNIL